MLLGYGLATMVANTGSAPKAHYFIREFVLRHNIAEQELWSVREVFRFGRGSLQFHNISSENNQFYSRENSSILHSHVTCNVSNEYVL